MDNITVGNSMVLLPTISTSRKGIFILIGILILLLSSQLAFGQHRASFSTDYRHRMQDSVSFEIPEVCELFHIVTALTPFGQGDTELIDKSTTYYQEVMAYFQPFQHHTVVRKIQKEVRRNRYNRLKMDACGFYFDEEGKLVKDETYPTLSFETKNWLEKYQQELADFAAASNFRAFYASHQALYADQIRIQKEQLAVQAHWHWLEHKFTTRYHSYRITFSPLVYGSHAANYFVDGDFRQSVMFIGPPYVTDKYTAAQLEGLAGRMVFTEIDHNYVNPLSETYREEIERYLADVREWNNMKYRDYPTAWSTFNEYMTYALYSLYVLDNYTAADATLIISRCEEVMHSRGFIRFSVFNQELINFYTLNRSARGEDLYRYILSGMDN